MDERQPAGANPFAPPASEADGGGGPTSAPGPGFRALTPLATVFTVVMVATMIFDLLGIANAAVTITIIKKLLDGEPVDDAVVEGIDQRGLLMAVGSLLLVTAGVVTFCMIMVRANRNARSFRSKLLQFTPGWAAGFFFVPLLGLWKPYQAMKEIWQASSPILHDLRIPALLPLWWWAYLLYTFAGQIAFRVGLRADDAQGLLRSAQVDIVASVFAVVAAVLAILVVRALARRQDGRPAGPATTI